MARTEGCRKRPLVGTDDEDEDDVEAGGSVATVSLSTDDRPSMEKKMEGIMRELSTNLKGLHVSDDDKGIKTVNQEVKMEEETGSRDAKENEQVFRVKQVDEKRSGGNIAMATISTGASSSSTSKMMLGPSDNKSVASREGQSGGIQESGSGAGEPSSRFGIISRKPPEVGDVIYAMFKNLENPWLQAEVLEIVWNQHTNQKEYVIRFEPTIKKRGEPTGGVEIPQVTCRKLMQVCLKMIASPTPFPGELPIGARVISKLFIKEGQPEQAKFYAGIVADHLKDKKKPQHYLIFFDMGAAQYVHADHVHFILQNDRLVWNDVYPDRYDFIKEYISKSHWPMVTLRIGQIVATELNGIWLPARIRILDNALAYAQFEHDGECVWIYRGSGRFRPLPRHLVDEEKEKINNSTLKQEGKSSSPSAKKMKKAMACSSFSAEDIYKQLLFFSGAKELKVENDFSIELDDPTLCTEYQGHLRDVEKWKNASSSSKRKQFVEHKCDKSCVLPFEKRNEFRKCSPLMIPLCFGWERHQITEPMKHEIYYRAPCGLRLNEMKSLKNYLKVTESDLPIDFFCFDYDVDCEKKFKPARALLELEDISGGKEEVSIELVNSFDWEKPPEFEYLTESELSPGVEISMDKGFLVCCDCEDGDCSDQDKCACWQMTKQGLDFQEKDENYPTQGYEMRKLRDKLVGAIHECNEWCTCKMSCTNRVVQNGCLWPLQVFKTRGKGWGVRALFDIPLGTFVGYYVGEIFESDDAEQIGKTRGDEYFLQMDYIETSVEVKPGYEKDVTDIEEVGEEDEDEDADYEDDSEDEKSRERRRSDEKERKRLRERKKLFGKKEDIYVIDSKMKGGVTRFMNHSCNPNLYTQNVFVETQDLRFPKVAMFTSKLIKAGSELTWDYHYDVGSVAETKVDCQCMAYNCKGRLL